MTADELVAEVVVEAVDLRIYWTTKSMLSFPSDWHSRKLLEITISAELRAMKMTIDGNAANNGTATINESRRRRCRLESDRD